MSQGFCTAYTPTPQPVKLSELRAKTDQQLLNLIRSKMELGLNFVALVEETHSGGNQDHAEQLLSARERRFKRTSHQPAIQKRTPGLRVPSADILWPTPESAIR